MAPGACGFKGTEPGNLHCRWLAFRLAVFPFWEAVKKYPGLVDKDNVGPFLSTVLLLLIIFCSTYI